MGRIIETVENILKNDDWPITLLEDRAACKTGFEGKHGQFICFAQERTEMDQFVFYSIFPVNASEGQFEKITEFITRANYGMVIGNFELDYTDGEIRYKTSVDVEDVDRIEPLIRNLIYANVVTMDKYTIGLMRVLFNGVTPASAIAEIEGEIEE